MSFPPCRLLAKANFGFFRGAHAPVLTVVYIAPNREAAEGIKARLQEKGLVARVRAVEELQAAKRGLHEVLVPQAEAEEALEVLNALKRH